MRLLASVMAFLILGCEGGALSNRSVTPTGETGSPAAAQPPDAGEAALVELHLDEAVSVGALHLRWLELDDSRCPQGVQCVWEGQVVVTLEISAESLAPERVELTLRAGVETGVKAVATHELRLIDVEPYPREGVTPERHEYVATIDIRPS